MKNRVSLVFCVCFGFLVGVGFCAETLRVERSSATPCTSMHRQLIAVQRVDSRGQLVSTPVVVDVCDRANVAYLEPK